MALTSNKKYSSKINFGQIADAITDDPAVAPVMDKPQEPNREEPEVTAPVEKKAPKETTKTAKKAPEKAPEKSLRDILAAQSTKTRGYQKSIYFEADTYDYAMKQAEKYNIRISQVINSFIHDIMNREENK